MLYEIPVANPAFVGNEKKYVNDCMESGWISAGKYVELFETAFAEYCNAKHAIACCNGTAALHVALLALGVEPGDEVIVPTLTFVATANAVVHCGAQPIFVGSESETWNLDPNLVEASITTKTKGIVAVHLYGHPAKMRELRQIADRHNLFLLEDAAEAHGALYDGQAIGSLGDAAVFSFYANKIIAAGEGGMVLTNDTALAEKIRLLRGQGVDPNRRYWHIIVGYNYRMMNLPAAIGLAQLEQIDWQLAERVRIAQTYQKFLQPLAGVAPQIEQPWARHVYWMFSATFDTDFWHSRDAIIEQLAQQKIETRPVFYPAHSLPPYRNQARNENFAVANRIAGTGISLPTWANLSDAQIERVCGALKQCRR